MKTVYVPLTDEEIGIVLSVHLMYNYVPFHRTRKRVLTSYEDSIGEDVWRRLIVLRDSKEKSTAGVILPLTEEQRLLFMQMMRDCLAECAHDETDLGIHLNTSDHEAVDQLILKFEQFE